MKQGEEIKGREENRMVETERRRKDGGKEGKGGVEQEGEEGRESRMVPLTTMRLECKQYDNSSVVKQHCSHPYLSGSRMLSILHHLSERSLTAVALCCCDHLLLLV